MKLKDDLNMYKIVIMLIVLKNKFRCCYIIRVLFLFLGFILNKYEYICNVLRV